MRILVLGLGNDLLSDDAVGLIALRDLRIHAEKLDTTADVEYIESSEHGIALLDYFLGYDKAIILDAIATGKNPPGTIFHLTPSDFSTVVAPSPHYTGLPEMIAIAAQLNQPFPSEIHIFACETSDTTTLGGDLTPAVREALPKLLLMAQTELNRLIRL